MIKKIFSILGIIVIFEYIMVIRPSKSSDAHSMSCIYVQTWQDTYLGVVPYSYLIKMSVNQLEQAFLHELQSKQIVSFVVEDNHEVVGFITGGYERNGNLIYNGEIYTLYVMKDHRRRGLGLKLASALAKRFHHFGIYAMLVQVLKRNPYRHFYKKINGIYLRSQSMPFAGERLEVEYYGWVDSSLIYC
jgi:ribosomal protein S18 acetylase RimI-like enzyme